MTIRTLRSGERIPDAPPRRYPDSLGYIRLRWTVAPGEEVEVREHRVFDGVVTEASHVHHLDHNKANNDPSNLLPTTPAEHARHHRTIDRELVIELYAEGLSTPEIGRRLGFDASGIWRALNHEGVATRNLSDSQRARLDDEQIRRLHAAGVRSKRIAQSLGYSAIVVNNAFKRLGLEPLRPGRPTNAEIERAEQALRAEGLIL